MRSAHRAAAEPYRRGGRRTIASTGRRTAAAKPAAKSNADPLWIGSLTKALQQAMAAIGQLRSLGETLAGRIRQAMAARMPGIRSRSACPRGTDHTKSLPARK